jgi:hypothetical protein
VVGVRGPGGKGTSAESQHDYHQKQMEQSPAFLGI